MTHFARRRRLFVSAWASLLVVACQGTPTTVAGPRGGASAGLTGNAAGAGGQAGGASATAGSAGAKGSANSGKPADGAQALSPNTAVLTGLTGIVRAPATIIADHGARVVSNNGSTIVSNNGASLISDKGAGVGTRAARVLLAAVSQAPFAGISVSLQQADGTPVRNADGQPLVAVTDAAGRYVFPGVVPARNSLLRVALADGASSMAAIAPAQASGAVDIDLVSTLTTTYILDRFVVPQGGDSQAVLDRLPASVEADTRARADETFGREAIASPAQFTSALLDATVEAMRKQDPAFDAQMDAVRKLLVAAGQSDFGNGQVATAVQLDPVTGMVALPDGRVLLHCPKIGRLWSLGKDGRLSTALDASLKALVPGADGTLITVATDGAIARLASDGKRTTLVEATAWAGIAGFAGAPVPEIAGPTADGGLIVAIAQGGLVGFGADGKVTLARPMAAAQLTGGFGFGVGVGVGVSGTTSGIQGGVDAAGRLYLRSSWLSRQIVKRIAPPFDAAPDFETLAVRDGTSALVVDGRGNQVLLETTAAGQPGTLSVTAPDGTRTVAASQVPAMALDAASVAGDGTLYVAGHALVPGAAELVYRVAGGKLEVVAGTTAQAAGDVRALSFARPIAVLPLADGGAYIADASTNQIVQVDAAGQVRPFAGRAGSGGDGGLFQMPVASAPEDGGPATAATLHSPSRLGRDAAGNVYALDHLVQFIILQDRINRIDPAGNFHLGFRRANASGGDTQLLDFVVEPDGTLDVSGVAAEAGALPAGAQIGLGAATSTEARLVPVVLRVAPDGTVRELLRGAPVSGVENNKPRQPSPFHVAIAPDGTLLVAGGGSLQRVAADGTVTTVATDARFTFPQAVSFAGANGLPLAGVVVCDAQGRLYMAHGQSDAQPHVIQRFDPRDGHFEAVVGPGTRVLSGTGVDDGIDQPAGLAIGPDGSLWIADPGHRQVKRVPADQL